MGAEEAAMKLYEISSAYAAILDRMQHDDSEPVFADTLEALEGELGNKLDMCARVLRTLEAEADAFKAEAERMTARRKTLESRAANLKQYMEDCLVRTGLEKVSGPIFTCSMQLNPPFVAIEDETRIPPQYFKVVRTLDKALVSSVLKAGTEVDGATLARTRSLRVR